MNLLKKWLTKEKQLTIEFCEKNLDRYLTEDKLASFTAFLNQKGIQYKEFTCLSQCELCTESPYAIVEGNLVTAATIEGLLTELTRLKTNHK